MTYKVEVDTEKLIEECVGRLNNAKFPSPLIEITRGRFVMCEYKISLIAVEGERAKLKIEMEDSKGGRLENEFYVQKDEDLKKVTKDDRLRGFKVLHLGMEYGEPYVKFTNEVSVKKFEPYKFHAERAEKPKNKLNKRTRPPIQFPILSLVLPMKQN